MKKPPRNIAWFLGSLLVSIGLICLFAPRRSGVEICWVCDRTRTADSFSGVTFRGRSTPSEATAWMESVIGRPHDCQLLGFSGFVRSSWFGQGVWGCSFGGPPRKLYRRIDLEGEKEAERLLTSYLSILENEGRQEAHRFVTEALLGPTAAETTPE